MKTRLSFMPALAAVFVCGFTHAAHAGLAAPKRATTEAPYVELTAPWSIGPITAKADNGQSFCSMRGLYPEGQTLILARDSQSANSIAVDFHKDMLDVGRQYRVVIRSGSLKRPVTGLAATRQILIMQTGMDVNLYSTLWNTHKVSFEFQKMQYNFNLDASAPDALRALGQCSDSFHNGTTFTETTVAQGQTKEAALPEVKEEAATPSAKTAPATAAADDSDNDTDTAAPAPQKKSSRRKGAKSSSTSPAQYGSDPALMAEVARLKSENHQLRSQIEVRNDVREEIASTRSPVAPVSRTYAPAGTVVSVTTDTSDVKSLLIAAGVASSGDIQTNANRSALSWSSHNLYGSAQITPQPAGKSLTQFAVEHVRRLGALCKGQFAQKVDSLKKAGSADIVEADISCIDGQNDAAAAVLFMARKGKLSIITQEGTPDQLNITMANRDALVAAAGRQAY